MQRGNYPFDLLPGDKVRRRDIKGRKVYTVRSQDAKSAWVYTHEGISFLREQLKLVSQEEE